MSSGQPQGMFLAMHSETKISISVGINAALLVASGLFVILHEKPYGAVIRKSVENPTDYSLIVRIVGIGAIAAGIFAIIRPVRNIGWLLAGGSLGSCALITFLIYRIYPEGFSYGHEPVFENFVTGWIPWSFAGLVLASVLFAYLERRFQRDIQAAEVACIQSLASAKETAEKETKDSQATLRTVNKAHTEELTALRSELAKERTTLRSTRAARPYESQLVAAFCISLTAEWHSRNPHVPFALNHFQGNLDKNFGDFVGIAEGSCWLIELKRDWSCVSAETRKHARCLQANALIERLDMLDVANGCHWLGWGEDNHRESILKFSPYWSTWSMERPPEKTIDNDTFVKRVFQPSRAVGCSPKVFASYIRFLAETAETSSDEEGADTILALIFQRDSSGRIRYWIERDLLAIMEPITNRYRENEKRAELDREARERERQRDDPNQGHGGIFL